MYGSQEPACPQIDSSPYYLKIRNEWSCSQEKENYTNCLIYRSQEPPCFTPLSQHHKFIISFPSAKKCVTHEKKNNLFPLYYQNGFSEISSATPAGRDDILTSVATGWSGEQTRLYFSLIYIHTLYYGLLSILSNPPHIAVCLSFPLIFLEIKITRSLTRDLNKKNK